MKQTKPILKLNNFSSETTLPNTLRTFIRGSGRVEMTGETLRFINTDTRSDQYTDAQIDDYQTLPRSDFLWKPPVRMIVKARFSHSVGELSGTAGFGFWNDPFMMTGARRPTLPRVIWFFYSSAPSNMKLASDVPGPGWKAGTLDALRWPFFALLPTAPLAVPLMNVPWLYNTCWPIGQRAIQVSEHLLDDVEMTEWHTYQLEWYPGTATFKVDDVVVLDCQTAPRGPLGLVIWLDNQYMVMTPWGKFGYGLINHEETQWMEIRDLEVITL